METFLRFASEDSAASAHAEVYIRFDVGRAQRLQKFRGSDFHAMHLPLFVDPIEHRAPALHWGTAVGSTAKRKRTFDPVDWYSLDAGRIE